MRLIAASLVMTPREYLLSQIEGLLDPTRVTINQAAIEAIQPDFSTFSVASARLPFAPANPRDAIVYILAQTALQYRFWDGYGPSYTRYTLDGKVGSAAMVAGFDVAWGADSRPGPAIIECARIVHALNKKKAAAAMAPVFGDIPDPVSRVLILGSVLFSPELDRVVDALDRSFRAGHAGVDEAILLSKAFPRAYGDILIKKAMLAVGLMVAEYRRAGVEVKEDLMAYADYQVPAVMRHMDILEYSPKLAAKVDGQKHIKAGSEDELAIRVATIIGCERFARHHNVTAAETDWFFWLKRKEPQKPFHLTDTTAY